MERLIFTDRKTSSRKSLIIEYAKYVITGLIMGIGAFMVVKSQFGLNAGGGIGSGSFSGGIIRSWNQIAETLAGKDGVFLDQLEGASHGSGQFLTAVLVFFVILSLLIAFSRNRWFALIYPLLFLPMTIGFGLSPSVLSMAVLALGIVMFLAVCPGRKEDSNNWKWSRMAYALAACGLALVIICVPVVSKLADKPEAVQKIDDRASSSVAESFYGESPLGEGDLTKAARKTGKGTAMVVTMSKPESLYLRGYVGDVLDGQHWETLPYSSYYENRNLIYWINDAGLNGLGQVGQAARLVDYDRHVTVDVDVEVDKASRKYAYIPYEITQDGVEGAKNWNDSFVTATRGSRLKEYSYSTGTNAVDKWTNVAGKIFTTRNSAEIAKYLETESHYNKYVYDNYLYISGDDMTALEKYVGDKGDQSRGHIEYNTAIKKVKNTLMMYATYDRHPGKPIAKRSAVNNFFKKGLGYDVHYATAATMMFRYYGIPARYVEGYIITPREAMESPDGVIEVKQSAAHAWTEIYVDGVGFVPIETCPEYYGKMEEADYNIGISNKSVKNNFDQNQAQGQLPEDNYKDADKGIGKTASRILMIVGAAIALAILALLALIISRIVRKRLALRKRKKFFRDGEPREAVRDMYRYMDEIGFRSEDTTTEIGNRASYSLHQVTDEDRKVMLGVLDGAKKQIRADRKAEKRAEKGRTEKKDGMSRAEKKAEKKLAKKDIKGIFKKGKKADAGEKKE